ncbi:MAG: hypothetical protein OEV72_03005, partial [Thermoleophilia bacterium]|nr:hypothetical protein [Thermoleophilia bacterium]
VGPRFAFVLWWIFGERVDRAFDSWIWPLLLLIFLPWTGLAYLVMWSAVGGVSGWEWIIVALGLLADLASYSSRAAKQQYVSRYG